MSKCSMQCAIVRVPSVESWMKKKEAKILWNLWRWFISVLSYISFSTFSLNFSFYLWHCIRNWNGTSGDITPLSCINKKIHGSFQFSRILVRRDCFLRVSFVFFFPPFGRFLHRKTRQKIMQKIELFQYAANQPVTWFFFFFLPKLIHWRIWIRNGKINFNSSSDLCLTFQKIHRDFFCTLLDFCISRLWQNISVKNWFFFSAM